MSSQNVRSSVVMCWLPEMLVMLCAQDWDLDFAEYFSGVESVTIAMRGQGYCGVPFDIILDDRMDLCSTTGNVH
jgi:hypothetical protein